MAPAPPSRLRRVRDGRRPRRRPARPDAGARRLSARASAAASSIPRRTRRPGAPGELLVGAYDDPAALDRFADGLARRHLRVRERARRLRAASRRAGAASSRRRARSRSRRTGSTRSGSSSRSASPCRRGAPWTSRDELDRAVAEIGLPAVLKTRRLGYDGKGQQRAPRSAATLEPAWAALGGAPLILEGFVRFDRELSILAVRGRTARRRATRSSRTTTRRHPAA